MARLRLLLVAAIALVMAGCPLLQQPENSISFTWDGIHYLFAASADKAEHPWAVGYTSLGEGPFNYEIRASASAFDAQDGTNTIVIYLSLIRNTWIVDAQLYESVPDQYTLVSLGQIPEGWIDSFIANRDVVGEQFAGIMPGPFTDGQMTHTLADVVFTAERLPDEEGAQ